MLKRTKKKNENEPPPPKKNTNKQRNYAVYLFTNCSIFVTFLNTCMK